VKNKTGNYVLRSVAALAAAGEPSRSGTSATGVSTPLVGAPSPLAPGPHAEPVGRLRRSLRACTIEGLFAELVNAFAGGALLTAWALYLNAGPLFTGLLVALPQIAQLLQIPGAWSTALLGHRRACLWLVGTGRQVGLLLAVLPFVPVGEDTRRTLLLAVAGVAAALGVLGNNAWVAWMGELVPRRIRGRYFGQRTGLCMLGGALASALAGLLMDWARAHDRVGAALAALQTLACLCGLVTVLLMRRQHDPTNGAVHEDVRLSDALEPLRDRRVRGVFVYHLAWNASVGLAGSFFTLHMLQNLKLGFALVAIHGTATAVSRMLAAPVWGALIDRLGARPVLATCSFCIAGVPFLWLLPNEHRLWPLALDALLAGTFWSGHALAAFALPLAVTQRRGRPFYIAAFSATAGLAFTVATATGGTLASWLPSTLDIAGFPIRNLQVLFVLSGVFRFAAAFLSLRIHEPAAQGVDALFSAITRPLTRPPSRVVAPVVTDPVEERRF
jgi:MFS family permease